MSGQLGLPAGLPPTGVKPVVLEQIFGSLDGINECQLIDSSGWSGAVVYRVSVGGMAIALRGWPTHFRPDARIVELHRLQQELLRSGLEFAAAPLPIPYPASAALPIEVGTPPVLVALASSDTLTFSEDRFWQIEEWRPGEMDSAGVPTMPRLTGAMRALAQWHSAAARYVPTDGGRQWFFSALEGTPAAVTERLAQVGQVTGANGRSFRRDLEPLLRAASNEAREVCQPVAELMLATAPAAEAQLQLFQNVQVPLQPCIRDIHREHILFTGDEVTGLIDVNAARTESVASDLSRLLGSFCHDDAAAWSAGLSAYRAVRPLSTVEFDLALALDHVGVVLSAMTWIRRLIVASPPRPAIDDRLRTRLEEIAGRLEFRLGVRPAGLVLTPTAVSG